jgi:RNA polymerase sigma factor (sigma-70 family)
MEPSLAEIEAVYRQRGADFFRLALARTGDREQARDAVQDAFANAIRNRRSYRGSGPLEAWIARSVINAAHDAWRAEAESSRPNGNTDAQVTVSENGGGPSVPSFDPEVAVVRDAVRQLPRRQRDALFLRFYLGLDYAVVGEVLGVEVGTVSASLHAARESLATKLKEVAR